MNFKSPTFPLVIAFLAATSSISQAVAASAVPTKLPLPLYRNIHAQLEARVNDLFSRLTEQEKLSLLTGTNFTSQPIPRLSLKGIAFADAGQGVRGGLDSTLGPATAFPCGTTMASTWDRKLVSAVGRAVGQEARNKGTGVQLELGPAVNIHRTPYGGRDSEYYTEDPYLAAQTAVTFIDGLQSTGVGGCVKHYACNNQESDRNGVDVTVGERALREIYLPAFEAAVVQAHVWAVMPAYNQVDGQFCTANPYLLKTALRRDWGFDGLALSDWGAVHTTSGSVNSGTDLEMPGPALNNSKNLSIELANGHIKQSAIDTAVRNILRTMIRCGVADPVQPIPNHQIVGSLAHRYIAYQAALEGIVLLKNDDHALPIDPSKPETIAVIGLRAKSWQIDAGGSPKVEPTAKVTAYDGIVRRLSFNPSAKLLFNAGDDLDSKPIPAINLLAPNGKHGLLGEYYNNGNFSGKPLLTRIDRGVDFVWDKKNRPAALGAYHTATRWTGKLLAPTTGDYVITVDADDSCRLWFNGGLLIKHWSDGVPMPRSFTAHLLGGKRYPIRLEYDQGWEGGAISLEWLPPFGKRKPFQSAVELAARSDAAIVFVGSLPEAEANDRESIQLDNHQTALIKAVAAANPRTIVVLNNGGPLLLHDWIWHVPAVVEAGFPGEMGGKALASIIFGDVSPSGKLVDTYAVRRQDYPDYNNYPGIKGKVDYAEGIYVGYRAFDKRNITPLFPFGYGLSYTLFKYSNLKISQPQWDTTGTVAVTADVTNVGGVTADEIAELYIEPVDPQIDRPVRELKGYERVRLAPGETRTATFTLDQRSFAYCDVPGKQWRADKGDYLIDVGGSSRNLPLQAQLTTTKTWTQSIPGMR